VAGFAEPKPATPAPKKHGLSPDSSDKNLAPPAKRYRPAPSVESLIDTARNLWARSWNEICNDLVTAGLRGQEFPVGSARQYLRERYQTKESDLASTVEFWVVVEIRKGEPVLCVKSKQDGIMWQMCSMQSSSKMLLRHTIMFKAMLLAAKDFESRDFLACDLFKRLLPFARDHC